MTFVKHLRSVSRAASQRLGILRKSWQVFHDRLLIGRCRGFVLPVLEYFSAMWCSAADIHLKLLDRIVSGASFLTGGVFECDLAHRRSVAVLCMLYKMRCNPMHPLYGALPVPYVPVRVTRGAVIAHQYTYAPPRYRTSQYRRTFILLSVSLWNDLSEPVFNGVGSTQEQVHCLFIGLCTRSLFVYCCFQFLFFRSMCWYCGAGVFGLNVLIALSQSCITNLF